MLKITTAAILILSAIATEAANLRPEVEKKTGDWAAVLYTNEGDNRSFCSLEASDGRTVFRVVRYKDGNDTFLEIVNTSWHLIEGRSKFSLDFEIKGKGYSAELMGMRDQTGYYHDFTDTETYAALLGMISQATTMTIRSPNGSRTASYRARQSGLAVKNFGDCLNSDWAAEERADSNSESYAKTTTSPSSHESEVPTQIYYGSRIGMVADISSVSGINTGAAQVLAVHTPVNAKQFCVEYGNDTSIKCVQDEMKSVRDGGFTGRAVADCTTGDFSDLFNRRFRFEGTNLDQNISARYVVRDVESGNVLDGSGASGYGTALGTFDILCPERVPVKER